LLAASSTNFAGDKDYIVYTFRVLESRSSVSIIKLWHDDLWELVAQRLARRTTSGIGHTSGDRFASGQYVVPWMLTDGITGAITVMVAPPGSNLEN
jgi:hypothetical protein